MINKTKIENYDVQCLIRDQSGMSTLMYRFPLSVHRVDPLSAILLVILTLYVSNCLPRKLFTIGISGWTHACMQLNMLMLVSSSHLYSYFVVFANELCNINSLKLTD